MEKDLSTPVTVEEDGWILSSGSGDRPSESDLRSQLKDAGGTGEAPPAAAPRERPAAVTAAPAAAEDDAALTEPATDEPPADAPAKRRRPHDAQRRIDQMHADLASERDQRIRAESALEELRRQHAARPAEPAAVAAQPPAKPKPMWGGPDGYEAQGKSWEEYEEDKATWNREELRAEAQRLVEERFAQERQRTEQSQKEASEHATRAATDAAFLERVKAARAKRPDYDKVIERLGDLDSEVLRHLIYTSPDGPSIGLYLAEHLDQARALTEMEFTRPLIDAIRRSTVPARILGYLATHPDEFDQLTRTDFVSAIAGIGRLEARLDVDHSVTTGAARTVTSARPPLRTVSGGAPPTRASASSADDLDFGPDYIAAANRADYQKRARRY